MTINMYIATIAWLLLAFGYFKRHDRKVHVPCMIGGIGLDLSLVVYLQFTRDAIQKALDFSMSYLQQIHIAASLMATLLYLPVLYLGFLLVTNRASSSTRFHHIRMATAALIARTIGFLFMFSM